MEAPEDTIETELEERLQGHSRAFESLLALTPAREYFGNQVVDGHDPNDQWNRKKQTKEEKRAAKKAKLDPANQKSALDVMKDRELKRKRELGLDQEEAGLAEIDVCTSQPGSESKRQKLETDSEEVIEARRRAKAEKKKEKRHAKQEKTAKLKAKLEAKKLARQQKQASQSDAVIETEEDQNGSTNDVVSFDASGFLASDMEKIDQENGDDASSVPTSPDIQSPAFDVATNHSTTSSSTSIVSPSDPTEITKSKSAAKSKNASNTVGELIVSKAQPIVPGTSSPKIHLPNIDQAELQARLRQKIEQLRARRKADGPDGKPAKSRQELLDQRRKKEELRKAAKQEQRRKAKEEQQSQQEAQLRGSGSPLSGDIFSPRSPATHENNFSFSRLAFDDGTSATADLSGLNDARKQKGRSDPKTALEAAHKKQARIAGLDAEKRADIAEKDLWLNAKKRAHGERVRDDTSLLKKALKRKEKQKSKSEKQWQEREDAVVKGKELKQKKREANLQKRKEEKGQKGKKKPGAGKGTKKKSRPGFEGRFKA